jgi:hypothetical protein
MVRARFVYTQATEVEKMPIGAETKIIINIGTIDGIQRAPATS